MRAFHSLPVALLALALFAVPPRALAACGDGNLEAGEACDDGNLVNGDCCTDQCTFEAPGSPCSDGNFCTTPDACNASGTCVGAGHPNCGVDLDHFKCTQASVTKGTSRFVRRTVGLADQFEAVNTRAHFVNALCNPVDKNDEGILDSTAHLTCYSTTDDRLAPFVGREVIVRNQFGEQHLRVRRPFRLCVPSIRNGVPSTLGIDHFRCYKARFKVDSPLFVERVVKLTDADGTRHVLVRPDVRFCTPVDKNGEGIDDVSAHLTCYRLMHVAEPPPFIRQNVTMTNQFGNIQLTPNRFPHLCVPSTKQILQ